MDVYYPFENGTMLVLGIDTGVNGAFSLASVKSDKVFSYKFTSEKEVLSILEEYKHAYFISYCVLEDFSPMPGQSSVSTKSQGTNFGIWQGWLQVLNIPYETVYPQKWQKEILPHLCSKKTSKEKITDPKLKRKLAADNRKKRKLATIEWVNKRFPDLHIDDSDKADAICISLFAKYRLNIVGNPFLPDLESKQVTA